MLLLLAIPALFVGNQACSGCHAEIYKRYSLTPMAMSSGRSLPALTPDRSVTTLRRSVMRSMARAWSGYPRVRSMSSGSSVTSSAQGLPAEALATSVTDFCLKHRSPGTAQTGCWDVSPGYASDSVSRWSRPIEPSCLFCHASQTRWRDGTLNAYADPAFDQNGVACERCHGPGSLHVAGKGHMVNPAKLAPAQRDGVCAQCHLTGQSRVVRAGRQLSDYRPGDLLSDFVAHIVPAEAGEFQVNSHVEKLAESGCKRSAGDRLWCGSCHDAHSVPAASERAAYFRAKCLTCHEQAECSRGFDCAGCHMPKNPAVDAGHGVFTDHTIPRNPAVRVETGRVCGGRFVESPRLDGRRCRRS